MFDCMVALMGKSYRQFKVRVYEHSGKSYRTDELLSVPLNSDIRDYCHTMDHAMTAMVLL